MKKLVVIISFLVSVGSVFAQHEGHTIPADTTKKKINHEGHNMGDMKMEMSPSGQSHKSTLPLSRLIAEKAVKPTGKRTNYDIYVAEKELNIAGKPFKTLTLNEGIPGPTLRFTEGDVAVIKIHNQLTTETSFHWHGILLPPAQDGVPYLNTPPIKAGETFTFEFPIIQTGTYWYHSHTGFQEQQGIYGSIVIEPQKPVHRVDKDIVLVLSDWINDDPINVIRQLKRRGEWYGVKRNNVQSLDKILKNKALGAYITQSAMRMPPMDISDIAYDKFLINGKDSSQISDLKAGDKVRLRVINAGTSTYFHVQYAGGDMQLIAADGINVQPIKVNHRLLGMAETYDFIITIPTNGSYEFRATAQDVSGHASFFLGSGKPVYAPNIPKPNLYEMTRAMSKMSMNGHSSHDGMKSDMSNMKMDTASNAHGGHDMENMKGMDMSGMKMKKMDMGLGEFNDSKYEILKSTEPIVFDTKRPVREVELRLTGDMRRYIWGFNDKPMSRQDRIPIKKGETVRFKLVNSTMMFHPIHLHGHFFRVLNGQNEYSPLKHTVSLAPMESVTIEFLADDEKDWMFHCHLLYHMDSGMARVVSYETEDHAQHTMSSEAMSAHKKTMNDNKFYGWGNTQIGITTNYLGVNISNNRNAFIFGGNADWKGNFEVDLDYERYLGQYFRVFAGIDAGNALFLRRTAADVTTDQKIIRGVAGIRYVLPFLIDSEVKVDAKGNVRFQLSGEQRLTRRLGFEYEAQWLVNGYTRIHLGLDYILNKNAGLFINYDTRYKTAGGGLNINF